MKILLVDDDPDEVRTIVELLRKAPFEPFDLTRVTELGRALAALREQAYDVVLMKLGLPDSEGLEALAKAREQVADRLPLVVLTRSDEEALAVEAVGRGAQDFLHKTNLTTELLTRTLRYALERHRVQRALLESEARHRRLAEVALLQSTALDTAANGILITDRAGTILWVNPAFSALTGFGAEEVLGRNPRFLKSGRHDQAFYEGFWKTISSGGVWRGEFINRRKDGTLRVNEETVTPVRSGGQEITHFIGVVQDITERKALGEALHQAQRLEAFGQLAGGVAHDFNNLLAIIRGNAELLLMGSAGLGAEAAEGLNHVIGAAERGAILTRQLLIFGRKQVLQPQPVTLNELIRNLAGMLKV
jgi:PAS domain S-box-containing protein